MLHLLGEFIGSRLVVVESSARSFRGTEGKIVDETKNTFVVETASGIKRIPKKGCVFSIAGKEVRGDEIMFRAEDRPKKLRKKTR
jgi:ribonuclease P protein subunit POP4